MRFFINFCQLFFHSCVCVCIVCCPPFFFYSFYVSYSANPRVGIITVVRVCCVAFLILSSIECLDQFVILYCVSYHVRSFGGSVEKSMYPINFQYHDVNGYVCQRKDHVNCLLRTRGTETHGKKTRTSSIFRNWILWVGKIHILLAKNKHMMTITIQQKED